jgi:probable rRNA maturation factor
LKLDIIALSPLWRQAPGAKTTARKAISAAARVCGVALSPEAEAALHLSDDARVRALNSLWRGKDAATNVLAFPAGKRGDVADARLLGDVVIAYETVAREAEQLDLAFNDHFVHLTVHGFLHLIGFDHETDAQAREMEGLERRILADLDIADPYQD